MEESIKTISYTRGTDIGSILRSGSRRQEENAERSSMEIVEQIREGGDEMVLSCLRKFDNFECTADRLLVNEQEYAQAEKQISPELAEAIEIAISNVRKFHQAQQVPDIEVETMPGVKCVSRPVPLDSIGLYIPGGSAPLFSTVLMLAIPAAVAGCRQVVLCTPPDRNGKVNSTVLYAAHLCGVGRIFKVGGAQAIAAMAFGTESIPRVDKIFGPGNRYVTRAKQMLSSTVAIDMPAGPSEVMVLADSSAIPDFVASDLLSQAEHGADSQVMLVCTSEDFAARVREKVSEQLENLPRKAIAAKALEGSRIIVLGSSDDMTDFANLYAAEHLIISMENPWKAAERITAAGSIFIGNYSPESAGDYASGTNHTLPTSGWARSFSGVNTGSFMRRMTLQELTREGLDALGGTIMEMAAGEGLEAHRRAVEIRLSGLSDGQARQSSGV